jgi:(S)-2-hydroxyglutarate dehydrogenase
MNLASSHSDLIVIGGGIVGLATAYQLMQAHPQKKILVLEKEAALARHQTGHNSGVLHSGIYYRPGSLKAQNCRAGLRLMREFCEREGLAHEICGKVIVASAPQELDRLQALFERGKANGVRCELIGPERLRELEPHCAGVKAIHVSEAGIVNYAQVGARLAERLIENGHGIVTSAQVMGVVERETEVIVETTRGDFQTRFAINCAGLHSDRVTKLAGTTPSVRIVPIRGEYYELTRDAVHFCRHLIYPVPDPRFPFLGVHLSRSLSGGVHCGPNAVLGLAREGYRKCDFNLRDVMEMLGNPGVYRLAARNWRVGVAEVWRSLSKTAFLHALQRLVPEVRAEHLQPHPAGVRAQALARDGELLDDFALQASRRLLHVINAPSPAATSSLSIGQMLAQQLAKHF